MYTFLPTIILRHRKENLKKCSLKGLESRNDMRFYTYPTQAIPSLEGYVMLHLGDETTKPLSSSDQGKGLFFLDSTWNYEKKMYDFVTKNYQVEMRSLPPGCLTAYPRKQTLCDDPTRGLATLEALYLSYLVLKRDPAGLLDFYPFKELFLTKNQELFSLLGQSQ